MVFPEKVEVLAELITETWDLLAPPRRHWLPDLDRLPPGQSRWGKLAWESRSFDQHGSQDILRAHRCVYAQSTSGLPVDVPLPVPGLRDFAGAANIEPPRW